MAATLLPQATEGAVPVTQESGGSECARPFLGPEPEIAPALRRELLDLAVWQEGLEKYALAMHLAVALADATGHLLGPCLNPQRLWRVFRAHKPARSGECAFAVASSQPCTCAADALSKGKIVWTQDRTGLRHFAVPLVLGGHQLGARKTVERAKRGPDEAVTAGRTESVPPAEETGFGQQPEAGRGAETVLTANELFQALENV
jgi:Sensory domain found in PocR